MILKTQPSITAFFLTGGLLSWIHVKIDPPLLLLERFWPGWGMLEVLALSVYAAFVTKKMLDVRQAPLWRKRIWLFFSIVFFAQLLFNLFWSITFFGFRSPWLAFGKIIILLVLIILSIIKFYPLSKISSYLLIPYVLWVSFATILNFSIAWLN